MLSSSISPYSTSHVELAPGSIIFLPAYPLLLIWWSMQTVTLELLKRLPAIPSISGALQSNAINKSNLPEGSSVETISIPGSKNANLDGIFSR